MGCSVVRVVENKGNATLATAGWSTRVVVWFGGNVGGNKENTTLTDG
jgi:hypothetical protein